MIAFVTRFVQGFASASIQTTCFTISGLIYKENQAAVLGYLEMSAGIGLTIAPVIGSLLYSTMGYNAPFVFFGSLFLLFGLVIKMILPYRVDKRGEPSTQEIFQTPSQRNY
jgi:MFS family permease